MLKLVSNGNWDRTDKFFRKSIKINKIENVTYFAEMCVKRLIEATPKDSGLTAESWGYKIDRTKNRVTIQFVNSNIQNGVKVALLLEFGHATNGGTWVQGKDFIAPIMQDVYNTILNDTWRELKKL